MGPDAATPGVSVVVPVRDGAATVEACVRSLLALDFPAEGRELIVVDNGSRDGTAEILGRFGSRIRVVREPRRGASAARNAGLRVARGRWIAFTDADCTVDRRWLARLLSPRPGDDVGIVGGDILASRPCNRIERFGERIHDHRRAIQRCAPPYAITMNWASPAAVLREVGGFDVSLLRGQDVDLAFRIGQAGYRLVHRPGAVVYHRNERTLGGLFREGFVHGGAGAGVRGKHRAHPANGGGGPAWVSPSLRRRLRRNVANVLGRRDAHASVCAVVFDSGKACGEAVARVRARRGAREGEGPDAPRAGARNGAGRG